MNRKTLILLPVILLAAACAPRSTKSADKAATVEQQAVAAGFNKLAAAQPLPIFDYSQLRQNMIEIQTAEANGIATTTFMFNLGTADPIHSCPSVGYPIPSASQLSSPDQVTNRGEGSSVVAQGDPVGVYRGDTSGTYVICVAEDGTGYATMWEGFVLAVPGTAHWDAATHSLVNHPDGTEFSTSKEDAKP